MAFELSISAPFHFSISVFSKHLSVFWGSRDAGFVLSPAGPYTADVPTTGGKMVKTWRNPGCNSLNMLAFGLHLVASGGVRVTPASAVV